MSLDFYLEQSQPVDVFWGNITHNMNEMVTACGLYAVLWRPEELGIDTAAKMIGPLEKGLQFLKADPEGYKKYNPKNGWGNYDHFVRFAENVLAACKKYPEAKVRASR